MKFDADIFDAVEFDDIESVKMYWTDEIDVDYQDMNGTTLLMLACSYNNKTIVEFLLQHEPQINLRNKNNVSAVDLAFKHEDKDIYNMLLEHQNNRSI